MHAESQTERFCRSVFSVALLNHFQTTVSRFPNLALQADSLCFLLANLED